MARDSGRQRPPRRPEGSRTVTVLLGLLVLAVLGGATALAATADQGFPLAGRTVVTAAFDEVGSLRAGDDVRIASARVGTVREVDLRPDQQGPHAVAVLELDGDRAVYRDASVTTASVGARSALGQKFVDLNPGTPGAGRLGTHDVIAARNTRGAQEIGDLVAVFDPPTREAMGATLREVGGGLAGRQDDLHDLLAHAPAGLPALGTVSRTLSADDGRDLTAVLRAADQLAGRFTGREQHIADLTGELDATLAAFAVDRAGPLTDTLNTAPEALRDVRDALDALTPPLADTETAMAELHTGARALGDSVPDVRGVLREGLSPLRRVPGVSHSAEPAVHDLTPVASDLRPLAPRVSRLLGDTSPLLGGLEPYAPEISAFFTNMTSALSGGDAAGHWLRVVPLFDSQSVDGPIPVPDPTVARNAYPAPGQAERDARLSPLHGRR
jgi:phospholipid/cholesterol/gamma-HCH transport system substrate-binding protein